MLERLGRSYQLFKESLAVLRQDKEMALRYFVWAMRRSSLPAMR